MGFVKRLIIASVIVVSSAASPLLAADVGTGGFSQKTHQQLAQAKGKTPAPSPATESRGPSNVDLVNKALNPGAPDPDVPLPHPDLANQAANRPASSAKPQIYGRQEDGGGVFGLRMPIPADRSAAGSPTRYSSGGSASQTVPESR